MRGPPPERVLRADAADQGDQFGVEPGASANPARPPAPPQPEQRAVAGERQLRQCTRMPAGEKTADAENKRPHVLIVGRLEEKFSAAGGVA
jgi:hypothetical protein